MLEIICCPKHLRQICILGFKFSIQCTQFSCNYYQMNPIDFWGFRSMVRTTFTRNRFKISSFLMIPGINWWMRGFIHENIAWSSLISNGENNLCTSRQCFSIFEVLVQYSSCQFCKSTKLVYLVIILISWIQKHATRRCACSVYPWQCWQSQAR